MNATYQKPAPPVTIPVCCHCGEACEVQVKNNDLTFCCEGCRQVYLLLNENGLCNYYALDKTPGIKAKGRFTGNRFAYLDDPQVLTKLLRFSSAEQNHVHFRLPGMHCSSCIYLLENLHRIHEGITRSQTDFRRKEISVVYHPGKISLREIVELLSFIGYEPAISLDELSEKKIRKMNTGRIYKIGIAGFCFSNIMMLSFPEYFSSGLITEPGLKTTFNWLCLVLSLPVLFYSASPFFISAWQGLKQRVLNIDGPIALATLITFSRSYYEIISGTGSGYLDSGTGIVFFMLVGRWFQDRTYDALSFDRDYRSYFPLGVSVIRSGKEENIPVTQLKKRDRIIVRNGDMIAADAILIKGEGRIDYSFISGETILIRKNAGDMIYAGARQSGAAIELEVISEVSQSYITKLWNSNPGNSRKHESRSFIHPWSRYFTIALYSIAACTAIYWAIVNPAVAWTAVTAVLIVACPCSLLLSATFTFGSMLRIFGCNRFYLKNAGVIESLAGIDTIVFDKTGTLTRNRSAIVDYAGEPLDKATLAAVKTLASQSAHPLSRIISHHLGHVPATTLTHFRERKGKGIEAYAGGVFLKLGAAAYAGNDKPGTEMPGTKVYVMADNRPLGYFRIGNDYRDGIKAMAGRLRQGYELHVLSGDNDAEAARLKELLGENVISNFGQSPQQKLEYIRSLQQKGKKVLMFGDGLNDAGALLQADAGVAVTDDTSQFSPACDAILQGDRLNAVGALLSYAKKGKTIVTISFILSIIYNIIGLSFAVQGSLSPMVAAILMPASSISIVLLVTLSSSLVAKRRGL